MTVFITGVAGFIGSHVAAALVARGEEVIGVDNINSYYDVRLKQARLRRLQSSERFSFMQLDVSDRLAVEEALAKGPSVDRIVHLAAQAGVRYSTVDPYSYVQSNVMGHLVMLEAAKRISNLKHFVYASSSSVYGNSVNLPYRETDRADSPSSLYAATKRADELISQAYSHLFRLPQTGLRFFTVYGPWGRPDMAYYNFADAILSGRPITLYDDGRLKRDFTYIDDIVQGVIEVLDRPPLTCSSHRVFNIGNTAAEEVRTLVALLETGLGRKANIRYAPKPLADVEETCASTDAIAALTEFKPSTPLTRGIPLFLDWFQFWHGSSNGPS